MTKKILTMACALFSIYASAEKSKFISDENLEEIVQRIHSIADKSTKKQY